MLDLQQLRSFAEVAERGTVAAAAAARGYTAPAVSQHVAKLEAELATPLFDRVGRRLELTDAGRRLLPIASEMFDVETRARQAADPETGTAHFIVAGLASALAEIVIPRLADLARTMTIEVHEREDADSLRDLRLAAIDLALVQEYDEQPVERNVRFAFVPILRDRLRLVLPPSMDSTTTLDQLGDTPWLINGHGTRCAHATTTLLEAAGHEPTVSGSVADNETLLALVAAGHGVTIVPELLITRSGAEVIVADQDLGVGRTIHAVVREAAMPMVEPLIAALTP